MRSVSCFNPLLLEATWRLRLTGPSHDTLVVFYYTNAIPLGAMTGVEDKSSTSTAIVGLPREYLCRMLRVGLMIISLTFGSPLPQ